MRLLDLSRRDDRLFVGFLAATAAIVAVLGWQAVESQEVKGALEGSFGGVAFEPIGEGLAGAGAPYVNEGDRTVTLEGAELIEPTANVELVEITAREPGTVEPQELEGYAVSPGETVEIVVVYRVTAPGPAGFEDVRLHYRAGGRAGQTP